MIVVDGSEAPQTRVPGVHFGGRDLEPPRMEAGRAPPHRLVAAEVLELEEHVQLRKPVLWRAFRIPFPMAQRSMELSRSVRSPSE